MSVTAIIVTYNSSGLIAECLENISKCQLIGQIVVVDNGSMDATVPLIKAEFSDVELLQNHTNIGFGRACNQALEQVDTEFVLLLNPDASIDNDSIEKMLDGFVAYESAAIIAPLMDIDSEDRSQHSLREPFLADKKARPLPAVDDPNIVPTSFISGSVALWKMEYMRQVGFFDPAIFLFCEDDDISLRVRRAGYELLLVKGLHATHKPGTSSKINHRLERLKMRSLLWSQLYLQKKYRGWLYAKLFAVRALIVAVYNKVTAPPLPAGEDWERLYAEAKHSYEKGVSDIDASKEKILHEFKKREEHLGIGMLGVISIVDEFLAIDPEDRESRHRKECEIREAREATRHAAKKHDADWEEAMRKLTDRYHMLTEKNEVAWREMDQRHAAHIKLVRERAELKDRIWAPLYFLYNAKQFTAPVA